MMRRLCLLGLAALLLASPLWARDRVDEQRLQELRGEYDHYLQSIRGPQYEQLRLKLYGEDGPLANRTDIELMGVRPNGIPIFYITHNKDAARTISTIDVWPAYSTKFALDGSNTVAGELAVWDGGAVRTTHQEFEGRVTQMDGATSVSGHATHVSGTLVAGGVTSLGDSTQGMSYEAPLHAYDWNSDYAEMSTAAEAGLLVSNHSYGSIAGWYWDSSGQFGQGADTWWWFGDTQISGNEDYTFGFYGAEAKAWDNLLYNAPYYMIFTSAGNDRGDGPDTAVEHYLYPSGTTSTSNRPKDGGTNGYDCVGSTASAKNLISVAAVKDAFNGYPGPTDTLMSSFSGWGPTDDGRIKPDLSANGISLLSAWSTGDDRYAWSSGTSMASPSLAGSANLLVQYWKTLHDNMPMLGATLKTVLIHTADELGNNPGPDYRHGWGLANIEAAADLIAAADTNSFSIQEQTLVNGATDELLLVSEGTEPAKATISWIDPGYLGTITPTLDDRTAKLVNDLDLRLTDASSNVNYPWYLNFNLPSNAALRGDNTRDNVEQIFVESPAAGFYTLTVEHKNSLVDDSGNPADQKYSLAISGLRPLYATENLNADLRDNAGSDESNDTMFVDLTWTQLTESQATFQNYRVMRNETEVGTTSGTSFTDTLATLDEVGTHDYTVEVIYAEGQAAFPETVSVIWEPTWDVEDESDAVLPDSPLLAGIYPNPFNPTTTVQVALPRNAELTVRVYNVLGAQVAELASGHYEAGRHTLVFDGANLSSGTYFVRATAKGLMDETRRIQLVR